MNYTIQQFIATLKTARQTKKMSQRDLALKIGLPQSHISKIEAGHVNLKLTSLIELARTLDHELMLIPRQERLLITHLLKTKAAERNEGQEEEQKPMYVPDKDD